VPRIVLGRRRSAAQDLDLAHEHHPVAVHDLGEEVPDADEAQRGADRDQSDESRGREECRAAHA